MFLLLTEGYGITFSLVFDIYQTLSLTVTESYRMALSGCCLDLFYAASKCQNGPPFWHEKGIFLAYSNRKDALLQTTCSFRYCVKVKMALLCFGYQQRV